MLVTVSMKGMVVLGIEVTKMLMLGFPMKSVLNAVVELLTNAAIGLLFAAAMGAVQAIAMEEVCG